MNVNSIKHIATKFDADIGMVVVHIDVTLDNETVLKERYAVCPVKRVDIVDGRIYGIVEMVSGASMGKKGVFSLHACDTTRFASRAKNAHQLWSGVVPEINRWLDAQALAGIRLRSVVNTLRDVELQVS